MLVSVGIFAIFLQNMAYCFPIGPGIGKKSPAGIATKISGRENGKYCPKTKSEENRALKKEQRGDLFEGDIIPSEKMMKLIAKENRTALEKLKKSQGRDVLSYDSMHWKDKRIPYIFDSGLSDKAKAAALSAFQDFATYTCVKFVPRTTEADYVRFFQGSGCYSYVGKNGGAQDLSIGSGCEFKGTVLHESMHAMGFFHEHTRLDRDNYVKINWQNIKAGLEKNFQKYAVGTADYLGQPYDFNSIMHYPQTAFASDPTKYTIEINNTISTTPEIGQRKGLSDIDIRQIKRLFQCDDKTTILPPITTSPATTTAPVVTSSSTKEPGTTLLPGTKTLPTMATFTPITNKPTTTGPDITSKGSSVVLLSSTLPTTTSLSTDSPPQLPTSVEQPTIQTTQPLVINPAIGTGQKILIQIKTGAQVGTYPQWPTDFSWNTDGAPQNCNCQACNCQCVQMNEPSAGAEWKSNYLCYKKRGNIEPAIEWSYDGEIQGKRCTHISDPTFAKYWDNNFLCVPRDSPYHFIWSFRGPVKAKDLSCIRMGVPGGPKEWMDNYLCAKMIKKDEEDV